MTAARNIDTVRDALKAAEMRWMSVEDAEITLRARLVAELGRERDAALAALEAVEARLAAAEEMAEALHSIFDALDSSRGGEPFIRGQCIALAENAFNRWDAAKEGTA